jgi:hypothetical protein
LEKANASHASTLNSLDDGGKFKKSLVSGEMETSSASKLSVFVAGQPDLITTASSARMQALKQSDVVGFPLRFLHLYPDTWWVANEPGQSSSSARTEFIRLAKKVRAIVRLSKSKVIFAGEAGASLRQFELKIRDVQNSGKYKYSPDYNRLLTYLSKACSLTKIVAASFHFLSFLVYNDIPPCAEVQTLTDNDIFLSAVDYVEYSITVWHVMNAYGKGSLQSFTSRLPAVVPSSSSVVLSETAPQKRTSLHFLLSQAPTLDQKIRICVSMQNPTKRDLPFRDIVAKLRCTSSDVLGVCSQMALEEPERFLLEKSSTGTIRKYVRRLFVNPDNEESELPQVDTDGSVSVGSDCVASGSCVFDSPSPVSSIGLSFASSSTE